MIIGTMRKIVQSSGERLEARIAFENAQDPGTDYFMESDGWQGLAEDAGAFLLAAYLPAWAAGEKRIRIEGTVCPALLANLEIASTVLRRWYPDFLTPPKIECATAYRSAANSAGVLLSGGVDSTFSVLALNNHFPPGHADRPRIGVLIDYQGIGGISDAETEARYTNRKTLCGNICAQFGMKLRSVRTNLRRLNSDMRFWMYRYNGALLAAIAQALGANIRLAYIAASYDTRTLGPWGSHPELDPLYSSAHVRIVHHGIEHSRLSKVRVLAGVPSLLNWVNVCVNTRSGGRNCGRCEKCVRTRLELLAIDGLAACSAFDGNTVSVQEVERIKFNPEYGWSWYEELITPLRAAGHGELVAAIERRRTQLVRP